MAKIGINMVTGTVKQEDVIIGIDLGTTNSLAAYIHPESGDPIAINYSGLGTIVPSIVHFRKDSKIVVGDEAQQMLVMEPENTIYSVKRLLGKSYSDLKIHSQNLGYKIIDDQSDGMVKIKVGEKFYTPIDLSAEILKEVKYRAEYVLKADVSKAVITVPAYFNDSQRQATRDAGKLAGLEVLRIVNEPTAASLAYGMGMQEEEDLPAGQAGKTIAVYDLGGGTFDVSILKLQNGIFEVLSTNGDTWLGGDDFDKAIVDFWMNKNNIDETKLESDKSFSQEIRLLAEKAKKILSNENNFEENGYTISLDEFNEIAQSIVYKTIKSCENALKDAEITKDEIDEVVMVGGSTRVALVYDSVAKFFNKKPHNKLNPDEVVALGAAIQADVLSGNRKDILLLDVTPLSLGIETMGGLMDTIITRNSKIPTKAGRQYSTQKDGQVNMKISVYQGERDLVKDNRKLGEFELRGIPSMPAGLPKVDVNFILNADGILKVQAIELRSNTKQEVEIKPQYGLTDDQVENMLLASMENAKEDMDARSLLEAKSAAEQLVYHTANFIAKHNQLLNEEEIENVQKLAADLGKAIKGKNKDAILKGMDDLDDYSKPLAERVMDASISDAMKGKKIVN